MRQGTVPIVTVRGKVLRVSLRRSIYRDVLQVKGALSTGLSAVVAAHARVGDVQAQGVLVACVVSIGLSLLLCSMVPTSIGESGFKLVAFVRSDVAAVVRLHLLLVPRKAVHQI